MAASEGGSRKIVSKIMDRIVTNESANKNKYKYDKKQKKYKKSKLFLANTMQKKT